MSGRQQREEQWQNIPGGLNLPDSCGAGPAGGERWREENQKMVLKKGSEVKLQKTTVGIELRTVDRPLVV